MSLRNSREKPTQIARLGRLLVNDFSRLALRYLLAQLKVNYRPLYPETIKWFSELANSQGEAIWDLVWTQLQLAHSSPPNVPDFGYIVPNWATSTPSARIIEDEEDEAEFRCPNMERQNTVVTKALSGGIAEEDETSVSYMPDSLTPRYKLLVTASMSSTTKLNCSPYSAAWYRLLRSILVCSFQCFSRSQDTKTMMTTPCQLASAKTAQPISWN